MCAFTRFVLMITLFFGPVLGWGEASTARVFIVAQNDGTEITDLLVPFAVLSHAGIDTEIVSTGIGPVNLMNGLELLGLRTMQNISPTSADLVIVPAVHNNEQNILLEWLTAAHNGGATVASICDGVEVLATAGLLDGRRATGHFYSASRREANFPDVIWVKNARYVEDGSVFTTAGISASAPASVRLVERFLGEPSATHTADHFGIDWDGKSSHDSSGFSVGFKEGSLGLRNWLMGWLWKKKYNLYAPKKVDEYSLALTVDALTRTYRAAVAIDSPDNILVTKNGLSIRGNPAYSSPTWDIHFQELSTADTNGYKTLVVDEPRMVLTTLFRHIAQEYGLGTADFVGMQLELPMRGAALH